MFYIAAIITTLLMIIHISSHASSQETEAHSYIMATATPGGTFYPVGYAICAIANLNNKNNTVITAISSAGSGENIQMLSDRQAHFAILQGFYGALAWKGDKRITTNGPQRNLRSITMLWKNVEHFSVHSKRVPIKNIGQLVNMEKGKYRLSIGKRNSGTEASGRHILESIGIDNLDKYFKLSYLNYSHSAEALIDNNVDIINTPGGVPVSAVRQAFESLDDKMRVLEINEEQLRKINQRYPNPIWMPYEIKIEHDKTYPNQTEIIKTIAQPNFLAVHKNIDESVVYNLTKVIYENLEFLGNIHAATKSMKIDQAYKGVPFPLHPGAKRYYREHYKKNNLPIPKELKN